jgi:hypothetical protein
MKTLLCSLFLLLGLTAIGQPYIVYSVEGEVYVDDEPLRVKQVLTDDSQLRFGNPEDMVYVISPKKGKLVISGGKAMKASDNEFLSAVKNALIPPIQYRANTTRSDQDDPTFTDLYDLKGYFRGSILILDSVPYQLEGYRLLRDATHYFELEYQDDSTRMQTVRLDDPDLFQLRSSDFFTDTQLTGAQKRKIEWSYVNGRPEKRIAISKFTLVQVPTEEVMSSLQVLYEGVGMEPMPFLYEEAIPFLEMRFGRINPGHLKRLLQEHLEIKF